MGEGLRWLEWIKDHTGPFCVSYEPVSQTEIMTDNIDMLTFHMIFDTTPLHYTSLYKCKWRCV